jgi:ribosomal protein L29
MAEISSKTIESLRQELTDKREALRVFRFGGAGSRSRNVREGRGLRKDIARILTEINARVASEKKTA